MAKRPPLARSELEIIRIVWKRGESSVREVLDALPPGRDLDFYTVQTYLRRLAAKGYLRTRKDGRTNLYSAAIEPDRVVSELTTDFVSRLFDGDALPLFQHLLRDRNLSDQEIDSLQSMLDEMKGEEE